MQILTVKAVKAAAPAVFTELSHMIHTIQLLRKQMAKSILDAFSGVAQVHTPHGCVCSTGILFTVAAEIQAVFYTTITHVRFFASPRRKSAVWINWCAISSAELEEGTSFMNIFASLWNAPPWRWLIALLCKRVQNFTKGAGAGEKGGSWLMSSSPIQSLIVNKNIHFHTHPAPTGHTQMHR